MKKMKKAVGYVCDIRSPDLTKLSVRRTKGSGCSSTHRKRAWISCAFMRTTVTPGFREPARRE